MVKIGLERINMQEGIMVEALLDSGVTRLVMSLKFAKKQGFKLKKLEKPMYVRNIDSLLNKEEPIEYIIEVNIYYQGHRERIEINVIGEQKWIVILGMSWLAHYNSEIDWRIGEVKMTRCLEECGKQWRPKQGKLGWQKQRKRKQRKKAGRNGKKEKNRKNKNKRNWKKKNQ